MEESIRYCQFFLHSTLLLVGSPMLGVGLAFQEECKNGTTDFLVFGGVFVLALSLVSLGLCIKSAMFYHLPDHQGRCLIMFMSSSVLVTPLLFLVMTIWVRAIMQHD